jgi:hypothetical protein
VVNTERGEGDKVIETERDRERQRETERDRERQTRQDEWCVMFYVMFSYLVVAHHGGGVDVRHAHVARRRVLGGCEGSHVYSQRVGGGLFGGRGGGGIGGGGGATYILIRRRVR